MISGSLHPYFNMYILPHLKCTLLEANANALACVCVCVCLGGEGGCLRCIAHTARVKYDGQCTVLFGVCYVQCVQCVVCKLNAIIRHAQLAVFTVSSVVAKRSRHTNGFQPQ